MLTGNTTIVGWAADLRPDGPGVDPQNVQVWLGGASGSPLGFAQYGWQRTDIAAVLDDNRFTDTGLRLGWETCTIPPGDYQVFVYAWRQHTADVAFASVDVTVAPCSPAPGSILFADRLDGANNVWPVNASAECAHRFEGGEYRVRKLGPNAAEDCTPPELERTVYGEVALEVDVRLVEPSPAAFASIGFRVDIAEFSTRFLTGYYVHLNPVLGTVALVYDIGPTYTRLAETRPASLRPGSETNRVSIIAEGSHLRVLVNGEPALDVVDDRLRWGTIAIGAGAPRGDTAEAAYRNLVVRRP